MSDVKCCCPRGMHCLYFEDGFCNLQHIEDKKEE